MSDPDAASALAAIIARMAVWQGRRCEFDTPHGGATSGTLSEFKVQQYGAGGAMLVRFREDGDRWFEVTGFPRAARGLPGQRRSIEGGEG